MIKFSIASKLKWCSGQTRQHQAERKEIEGIESVTARIFRELYSPGFTAAGERGFESQLEQILFFFFVGGKDRLMLWFAKHLSVDKYCRSGCNKNVLYLRC